MSEHKEKMYMAWHCGEEMLNPEIYGNTKKEYNSNLRKVLKELNQKVPHNYLMVNVEITIKGKTK